MKNKSFSIKQISCKRALCMLAAIIMLSFYGCSNSMQKITESASPNASPVLQTETIDSNTNITGVLAKLQADFSDRDLDYSYDENNAVKLEFANGTLATVPANTGITLNENILGITKEGTYILSGEFNGTINISVDKTEKVQFVLKGVNITSENAPAINGMQSDKIFITLADGSENTLSDSSAYLNLDEDNEPSAALFSKDDLTINGTGSLLVNGNYKHGIVSKDDLTICGAKITVNSQNTAIRGRDELAVKDAEITAQAKTNALDSNNDKDEDKGNIIIENSKLSLISDGDAVQAVNIVQLTDTNAVIKSGGGAADIIQTDNGDMQWNRGGKPMFGQSAENTNFEETISAKGIKSGLCTRIDGGTLDINSNDDAVHSNGYVVLNPLSINISSSDDAVHADSKLFILAGNINVAKSYEGLEGRNITVYDGNINITASDDGLNSAGGADSSGMGGMHQFGHNAPDNFASQGDVETFVKILGGNLLVNASGDGIDSNGALLVSGGRTIVEGPTNEGNGALDYLASARIEGGTFIALGTSGMAMNFTESIDQCSALVNFKSVQEANTPIAIYDENGKLILAVSPSKSYSSVVVSSPKLKKGNNFELKCGGTLNGNYSENEADYNGGNTYTTLNFENTVLNVNTKGGFGGGGDKEKHNKFHR